MEPLSPQEAVNIADKVYELEEASINEVAGLGEHNPFVTSTGVRFEGTSGVSLFNRRSGFGYVARGEGSRRNEALIAIRGTIDKADWLTDLNAAFETGASGELVHAGFNRAFKSFKDDIEKSLNKIGPSAVHIIGHSLGGALANLTADYVKQRGVEVKVYSFGAPRTVTNAVHLTKKIGEENIYRVYHTADPVSMVPIFPFQPVPTSWGHFMFWNGPVAVAPHLIKNYIHSIGGLSWSGLRAHVASSKSWWESQTKEWLQQAVLQSHLIAMGSAVTLWMILFALDSIIKTMHLALNTSLIAGFTVIDRLAQLLYTGALQSVELASQVHKLMSAILIYAGQSVGTTITLTVAFMRWVLETLFRLISTTALAAVHAVVVK